MAKKILLAALPLCLLISQTAIADPSQTATDGASATAIATSDVTKGNCPSYKNPATGAISGNKTTTLIAWANGSAGEVSDASGNNKVKLQTKHSSNCVIPVSKLEAQISKGTTGTWKIRMNGICGTKLGLWSEPKDDSSELKLKAADKGVITFRFTGLGDDSKKCRLDTSTDTTFKN